MNVSRILKTLVRTGPPFGLVMGFFFAWQHGPQFGLWGGLASGILFGAVVGVFVEAQRKRLETQDAVFEGENVLFQGPANHFLRGEGRGGWLVLTPARLAFRSHGKNIQNQPVDIALASIRSARAVLTLGLIPNGLRVERINGSTERFVISTRRSWEKRITEALQEAEPIVRTNAV